MAYLNQCYLSYYLRSGLDHDQVVFSNHQGRFQARDFRPMLMSLYDNDPLQFPFNWENFEKKRCPSLQMVNPICCGVWEGGRGYVWDERNESR